LTGKSLDWGDEALAKQTTKETFRYKAVLGHTDIIKIVGKCDPVYVHTWQNPTFQGSNCSRDEHGACPICDRASTLPRHDRKLRFATTVLHIARVADSSKALEFIGKLIPWVFADDKKDELIDVHQLTGGKLMKVELMVKVNGKTKDKESFQNLRINHLNEPFSAKLQVGQQKILADLLNNKTEIEKVYRMYHPTPEDLARRFSDAEKVESFNPQDWSAPAAEAAPVEVALFPEDPQAKPNDFFGDGNKDPLEGII